MLLAGLPVNQCVNNSSDMYPYLLTPYVRVILADKWRRKHKITSGGKNWLPPSSPWWFFLQVLPKTLHSFLLLILFSAHLYLPVCILRLAGIITHPTAALSLHPDVASPDPEKQIGSKQAVTGNHTPFLLQVASAPAWSHGWSNRMSGPPPCTDCRCCVHCF